MSRARILLGLTGLYCAGKNFVGKIFEDNGFAVLDLDKLGHIALENRKDIIAKSFGNGFLKEDGAVDRRALGKYVFSEADKLTVLEKIVHPEVNSLTLEWLAARQNVPCVINAALLRESYVFPMLDAVIFVKAPYIIRMLRAKKRDGLSWHEIRRRFASQQFASYYTIQRHGVYYINNWGFGSFSRLNHRCMEKKVNEILSVLRG
jgi:dephospho-CoA kinase